MEGLLKEESVFSLARDPYLFLKGNISFPLDCRYRKYNVISEG